jgi:anaerobic magnesium-protoporphyrin IX monomethyl ester cyclase
MDILIPPDDLRRPRRRSTTTVPYLLVNPPLTDPTAPYHSIPYLVGAARAAGHDRYRCVDANLDALTYLAQPAQVGAALRRARALRARIDRTGSPTRRDEIAYRQALAAEGLTDNSVLGAIEVFRDAELFYHRPTYRAAVAVIHRWLDLLALQMPPGIMEDFLLRPKSAVNLCSTTDLADDTVIDAIAAPFEDYLRDEFRPQLSDEEWGLVGFSVNYVGQLPVALRMARLVAEVRPQAVIVFGGTEVGDLVKYTTRRDALWRVFSRARLLVPGEGESALIEILDAVAAGSEFAGIRGVMARDRPAVPPHINYENVAALPSPAYDVWAWQRYWSPEPVILHSPTRGCYWNKCTFCDYGLNTDRPTSPSRERPVETVLEDLRQAAKVGRTVYFAVDAMSPRYLRTLAAALSRSDLDVRWGAELRLERTFPRRGVGAALAASGCVAISFGYESGSQRILDLIDKGVRINDVPGILTDLAEHGIAAQMMGFTGFPTESTQEARRTYEFLHEHDHLWAIAGIGTFELTPGSIVAKQPDRFGVELLPMPWSDDIHRYRAWRETDSSFEHWPEPVDERIPEEYRRWLSRSKPDRPFAGGIDSTHSLLYYARYGPDCMREADPTGTASRVELITDAVTVVPFASLDGLTSREDLIPEMRRRMIADRDTTSAGLNEWLAEPGDAEPGLSTVLQPAYGSPISVPGRLDLSDGTPLARAVRLVLAGTQKT